MKPRDYQPDELKGARSAPVPGFPGVRADEQGRLWKRRGYEWVRVGDGPSGRVTLKNEAGKKVGMAAYKAVCMAWHGTRPKGWCVKALDGDYQNTKPTNLEWVEKRTGRPRKLRRWDELEVLERAEAGEQLTDLADEFDVSVATMSNLCRDYMPGGPTIAATRKLTPEERAELVRQRKAGVKLIVLQTRFKRSDTQIRRIMQQAEQEQQCTSIPSD